MDKITTNDLKNLTNNNIESRTHPTVVRVSVSVCSTATPVVPTSKCASVVKPCNNRTKLRYIILYTSALLNNIIK